MLRTSKLTSLLCFLLVVFFFSSCRKEDEVTTPDTSIGTPAQVSKQSPAHTNARTAATIEEEILQLVNTHRAAMGLAPLTMNTVISTEALQHSQNIANGTVPFGHDGFGGRSSRIRQQLGGNGVAENVAASYRSAKAVVTGWLNSSGHKANIEGSYTHTGIGVATSSNGQKYYTQIFLNAPNLNPNPTPPTPPTVPTATLTPLENDILTLINNHRVSKGLATLKIDSLVQAEARTHNQNMANGTVPFGHTGFDDRANRLLSALNGWSAAENVAYSHTSAQRVVNGWLGSSGHRANIEGNFTLTGISAVKNSSGKYYYTQFFVRN
jgi:uncharacterized protein YkwD